MSCAELDRVTPTKRPTGVPASGYQSWRDLLFVHYPVDASVVRAVVPPELELDLWDGRAWVGIVPFAMKDVRLRFFPKALGMHFLETNLRTYVHHRGEPGVYFFSLEAESLLAVKGARWGWGLPYHHATMSMRNESDDTVYRSTRKADRSALLSARYRVGEALGASLPGSFEFFLLERYLLFSVRGGRVKKGQVHHHAYPAHRAEVFAFEDGLMPAAGLPRAEVLPPVVHFSPGVDVEVFGPWRVP